MTLTDKYPSEKHYRPWHRVLSGLMAFLVFFQATIPGLVHASQLRDLDIQSQLHSNIRFAPAVVSDEQPYLYQNIDYFLDKKTNFFTQEAHNGQPLQYPTGIHWFYAKHHAAGPDDLTSDAYILLGNEYVQSRFIRMQIESLLNRQWITAKYQSETDQILALYRNGLAFASQHGLAFGEKRAGQAVTTDMILPELRRLQEQDVIVPVVYLTKKTIQDNAVFKKHRVEFLGRLASWGSINIDGQTVLLGRNTMLKVAQDLRNHEGRIHSEGSLNIHVGGTLANHSGRISAAENINIVSQQFDHKTVVHRFGRDYGYDERLGIIASVDSDGGNINIQTFGNTWIEGAVLEADNSITIDAGGSINVSSVTQKYHSNQEHGDFKKEKTVIKHLKSRLSAKDTIRLIAKGGINITASELYADEGTIEIMADHGIYIGNAFDQTQHHNKYNEGGWKVEQTMFQTVAIRSALDAGKKVVINTALGHITLQAAKLRSGEGAEIRAEDGRVNFLMAKEQDHYFHHKIKKTFWKIKTDTKTDQVDTAVYNEIIGGVKVHATHGLTMEFGQKEGVTLDEMMDEFAENESLSWMNEVYNHPKFDGKVKEVFHRLVEIHKHDKTSSLSPAAMAIIAIAVACVMGPGLGLLGQGAGAGIQGAFGISQAAMQAGAVSLATQAVAGLALHNGDPFKTMEDMLQEDSIKAVATAMVTAGVLDYMDEMEFFANAEAAATTAQAQKAIDIANQAKQVLIQSSVRAGINTAINGGDFSEQLLNNLKMSAINAIGEKLASKIGEASKGEPLFDQDGKLTGYGAPDMNTLTRYLAHAGVGCLTGTLTSEVSGSKKGLGCSSGAGGAVIGELIADAHRSHTDSAKLEKEILEKQEEVKRLLVGEDGKDIDLTGDITPEQRKLLAKNVELLSSAEYAHEKLRKLQAEGVSLAKFGAGLAAFIAGADVDIAANAGENAAEHNAFWFVVYGAVLLYKAYSAIATIGDIIDFADKLEQIDSMPDGPEKTAARNQLIFDIAEGLALDIAIGKGAGAALEKIKAFASKAGLGDKFKGALNKLVDAIENSGPRTATNGPDVNTGGGNIPGTGAGNSSTGGGSNPSTGGDNPNVETKLPKKIDPKHKELINSHPNAHSFERHGGNVTDEQLMKRALTGVAPDGSKKVGKNGKVILPPMSSAFHNDELLVFADQHIRKNGLLLKALSRTPGETVITVTSSDVGDLGVSLGRGYKRITSSRYRPEVEGAPELVKNLRSVQAVFEYNAEKGIWETITIFPVEH